MVVTRPVSVQSVTSDSVTIVWHTATPATACVEYGPTLEYGKTSETKVPASEHAVTLHRLAPGQTYFYRVRCGGGMNHRFGLDDAILIKDNHIAVAGGVIAAIRAARAAAGHLTRIEIEIDTLDQLAEAMVEGPDAVLLDNMAPDAMREAVLLVAGRAITEASGNVTLETVGAIAETGVDMISSGWITHSAPILDLALDVVVNQT
jgi:nicotinate-nucleotide pyrophosphorylase (carboxylating)